MQFNFHTVQALIVLVSLAASVNVVQAAQQTFRDEAGRVIYAIDDDGTVSMSILMGKEDCQKKLISPRWKAETFEGRCCK